jgi:hypothetical protein
VADGSYTSVLINPKIRGKTRQALIDATRAGRELDPDQARVVRVAEYTVPDRDGDGDELICLIATITDARGHTSFGVWLPGAIRRAVRAEVVSFCGRRSGQPNARRVRPRAGTGFPG